MHKRADRQEEPCLDGAGKIFPFLFLLVFGHTNRVTQSYWHNAATSHIALMSYTEVAAFK